MFYRKTFLGIKDFQGSNEVTFFILLMKGVNYNSFGLEATFKFTHLL